MSCLRIHTGDRPYRCVHPGCEKAFTQLSNLQVIINSPHSLQGIHHPAVTSLVWFSVRLFALPPPSPLPTWKKSHQRQHNKDKPFKCSNCFRAYSDSASLQTHLPAHAIKNAKAYCCSMCGRAYTSVSAPPLTTPHHPLPPGPEFLKSAVAAAVYVLVLVLLQETYLMKHMSKHTMVEHLVCHRSPVHGTDSPAIPLRISLIWDPRPLSKDAPRRIRVGETSW